MEIVREGNSYTCETITRLHAQYPEDELYYIVGADTLFQMEFWKNPEQIFYSVHYGSLRSAGQGRFCADAAGKIPRVPLPRGYPFHAVPSCRNFFYPGAGSPAKGTSVRYLVPNASAAFWKKAGITGMERSLLNERAGSEKNP